jgi:hypothetical protein
MGIFDFLFGAPNTGKLEANKDVKGLIKALEYNKDSVVRAMAAEALGELGDPKAVDPLINALKYEAYDTYDTYYVRASAAAALGELGDPKAVDPLINALKDDDYDTYDTYLVRASAAAALGELGDPKAVDPLINALKDQYSDGRVSAAKALGMLHRKGCTMHINKSQILERINYEIKDSSHEDVSYSSDCHSHTDHTDRGGKVYKPLLIEYDMEW